MKIKVLLIATAMMILCAACANNAAEPSGALSQTEAQVRVSGEPNLAGAYQEMSEPEFWMAGIDNLDEILMSESEIREFNKNVPNTDATKCVDLNQYKRSLGKEELLEKLRIYAVPEETRYIGEQPLDEEYFENLFRNRNESGIAEQNPVRLGVIIQNTELRSWPTADVSYSEANDIEFDLGCETVLKTCERVAVLHESTDQEWLYVQAYNYIGWVRAVDVAFCTEAEWKTIGENTNWLVVTGNRIILDFSNENPAISRRELTMGTKLILLKDKPDLLDGISTMSSYVVLLPVRDENGALSLTETRVPQGLDVTEGFLDYTTRNVIEQSFKMMGERYGWSSLWNARDCASFIMDIYHCFGIELPRNASKQVAVEGKRTDVSGYSDEDKQALILSQPVGTLLHLDGHIMLYLGEYQGKPYIIHQTHGFIPKGETEVVKVACTLVSDLEIKRSNGETFLNQIRTVNAIV